MRVKISNHFRDARVVVHAEILLAQDERAHPILAVNLSGNPALGSGHEIDQQINFRQTVFFFS